MKYEWAEREAENILKDHNKDTVIFETGYGASGKPHIGTFREVLCTFYISEAVKRISGKKVKIICYSDDIDALRKDPTPDGSLKKYIGMPLYLVPDPDGKYKSFRDRNNNEMKKFLKNYVPEGDIEFRSSYDCYTSGQFDNVILKILEGDNVHIINNIMKDTVREERRKTYSVFMPIDDDGRMLMNEVVGYTQDSVIAIVNGKEKIFKATSGRCKLQWKPDWAMRWYAYGVDFEMHSMDLIQSYQIASKIVKALGGTPPRTMVGGMFLDAKGAKVSKSKGNGISMEQLEKYMGINVLKDYMCQKPCSDNKIGMEIIPRQYDNYISNIKDYSEVKESFPQYSMILNIINAYDTNDVEIVMSIILKSITLDDKEQILCREIINRAILFYNDYYKKYKKYRDPSDEERKLLLTFASKIRDASNEKQIIDILQEISNGDIKSLFKTIYEVLFGQESGPRLGSFIMLFGIENFCLMINNRLYNKKIVS